MPSKGLRLPILLAQEAVFKTASPQNKLTPRGFLDYLLNNNRPRVLSDIIDDKSGYIKDVKIRFKKRMILGQTVTTDDCSIQGRPAYYEQTIPSTLFRKYALFFDWKVMELFTEDALAARSIGSPPTVVMQEVIDSFKMVLNGLLGDIDNDMLIAQAANFGVNAASGVNTVRTTNIPLSTVTNNITEGWTQVMADAMLNEIEPTMEGSAIIGSGLINNYMLKNMFKPGPEQSLLPKFYYDPLTAARWGANQFGLFQRDAVQFINICRFRGIKSGHFGTSNFGTIKWPVKDSFGGTGLSDFEFDFQAREVDCPTDDMIIGGGEPEAVGRGLVFDLMASYQSVYIPADGYAVGDPLFGTNGTTRYVVTNV